MARRYNAFLVRPQSPTSKGEVRVEVVHLQSGARSQSTSLATAVYWMQDRVVPQESAGRDERSGGGVAHRPAAVAGAR